MKRLKELYLSIFVLFSKLGWGQVPPPESKGVGGVTFVQFVLVLALGGWIQASTGWRWSWNPWVILIVIALMYFANRYLLVVRAAGTDFEKTFDNFASQKRTLLYFGAMAIILAVAMCFYLSAQESRWALAR